MRASVIAALRGVAAGAAALAFVLLFLLAELRTLPLSVLVGLLLAGIGSLAVAAGPRAVLRLLGVEGSGNETGTEESGWWLARLEPTLDDSWNEWSDVVLTLGLGALGIGSLAYLAVYPGDDPPIGLLVTGFLGINGALVTLAAALK